jgi:hypothetical protein
MFMGKTPSSAFGGNYFVNFSSWTFLFVLSEATRESWFEAPILSARQSARAA